jgi:hypothetical protein
MSRRRVPPPTSSRDPLIQAVADAILSARKGGCDELAAAQKAAEQMQPGIPLRWPQMKIAYIIVNQFQAQVKFLQAALS